MKSKQDIVYILGSGSKWNNKEILYSLRSLSNLEDCGRVFIVGRCPYFIDSKKVHHIDCSDPTKNKLLNAMHKIRIACSHKEISEDFILMNDDFFFLKKTRGIPYYNMGTLEQMAKNHTTKGGYYYAAINGTIDALKKAGVEKALSFELHYPIVINKKLFLEIVDPAWYAQRPLLFRSLYGNLAKIRSTKRQDLKIYTLKDFERMGTPDFVSTDNKVCLDLSVQDWFARTFPQKSRYEK